MRVTSLKTIYLTEEELKQVISNHLREKGDHILAEHLHTNICTMEWLKNGNFAISIDGEVNEKCLYTAVSSRIDKLNNDTTNDCLLLSWIDYDDLAYNLLYHFRGNLLISIGNYENISFQYLDLLESNFVLVKKYILHMPWDHIEQIKIYKRKKRH